MTDGKGDYNESMAASAIAVGKGKKNKITKEERGGDDGISCSDCDLAPQDANKCV